MAVYRSALGRTIDMTALSSKNEKVRAVGNMNVNARGDTIDGSGKVIKSVNDKTSEIYAKTVGNRSAQPVPRKQQAPVPPKPVVKEELTDAELELEESFEDDFAIEQIKAQEVVQNAKTKKEAND